MGNKSSTLNTSDKPFDAVKSLPDAKQSVAKLQYHTHEPVGLHRSLKDIIMRGDTKGNK